MKKALVALTVLFSMSALADVSVETFTQEREIALKTKICGNIESDSKTRESYNKIVQFTMGTQSTIFNQGNIVQRSEDEWKIVLESTNNLNEHLKLMLHANGFVYPRYENRFSSLQSLCDSL